MKNKIKIFITYKNRSKIIKSDILIPIQTGRAIADKTFEDMIGDETGENISLKNSMYSELSAQYWAWKHYEEIGNPDYIGFMHYRRHFIRSDSNLPNINDLGCREYSAIDENYIKNTIITKEYLEKQLQNTECIIGEKIDFIKFAQKKDNPLKFDPRWAYCVNPGLHEKDFDYMLESVKRHFPEYTNAVNLFEKLHYNYWYNMFIMKKELFFRYCEFLFTVLKDCEEHIDITYYNGQGIRTLGYLGERLLTIFILKLQEEGKFKIKENPISFIQNTTLKEKILPAFENNQKAICFSCSDKYAKYLLVTLLSLKENSDSQNKYDILIFEHDICNETKEIIKREISAFNISVRFVNMNDISKYEKMHVYSCVSFETYFKLEAPNTLANFDKLLFLDVDILIKSDINELLEEDLKGKTIGAHYCTIWAGIISQQKHLFDYTKDFLELDNPYDYIQAGVLLIDVKRYIQNEYSKKCIEFAAQNNLKNVDQCAINHICKSDIHHIKGKWNYETAMLCFSSSINFIPDKFCKIRKEQYENPAIIHYAGVRKPWFYIKEEYSYLWWEYARRSPFYEIISQQLLEFSKKQGELINLKILRAKILSIITIGESHKHHKLKLKKLKQELNQLCL